MMVRIKASDANLAKDGFLCRSCKFLYPELKQYKSHRKIYHRRGCHACPSPISASSEEIAQHDNEPETQKDINGNGTVGVFSDNEVCAPADVGVGMADKAQLGDLHVNNTDIIRRQEVIAQTADFNEEAPSAVGAAPTTLLENGRATEPMGVIVDEGKIDTGVNDLTLNPPDANQEVIVDFAPYVSSNTSEVPESEYCLEADAGNSPETPHTSTVVDHDTMQTDVLSEIDITDASKVAEEETLTGAIANESNNEQHEFPLISDRIIEVTSRIIVTTAFAQSSISISSSSDVEKKQFTMPQPDRISLQSEQESKNISDDVVQGVITSHQSACEPDLSKVELPEPGRCNLASQENINDPNCQIEELSTDMSSTDVTRCQQKPRKMRDPIKIRISPRTFTNFIKRRKSVSDFSCQADVEVGRGNASSIGVVARQETKPVQIKCQTTKRAQKFRDNTLGLGTSVTSEKIIERARRRWKEKQNKLNNPSSDQKANSKTSKPSSNSTLANSSNTKAKPKHKRSSMSSWVTQRRSKRTRKCTFCSNTSVIESMQEGNVETPTRCKSCKFDFKIIHFKGQLICSECKRSFTRKTAVVSHFSEHTGFQRVFKAEPRSETMKRIKKSKKGQTSVLEDEVLEFDHFKPPNTQTPDRPVRASRNANASYKLN